MNELIELIKSEKVCLWVGSGMSLYAGYPGVKELKELLIESIPQEFKNEVSYASDFSHIADVVVNSFKGDKQVLRTLISKTFGKMPTHTYHHDLLGKIPFFKTIITTNYDRMIEDTFAKRAVVIRKPEDRMMIKHNLTTIYKIHGCVDYLDGLVLTKSDYHKLYQRDFTTTFWGSVFHEMASKHHLFLGYGYEDGNVRGDFEHLIEHLPKEAIKRYHISPSISKLKQNEFERLNIIHYDCDGGEFISYLVEQLKSSLYTDLKKNIISIDSAREFIESFDFKGEFVTEPGSTLLTSLEKLSGSTEHKINIAIDDNEIAKNFKSFLSGDQGITFDIYSNELSGFSYSIEGFSMMDSDGLEKVTIINLPSAEATCKVIFQEDNFEIDEVVVKVYKGQSQTHVEVKMLGYEFSIRLEDKKNVKFDFASDMLIVNVKNAFLFFKCIDHIVTGKAFTVIKKGTGKFGSFNLKIESSFDFIKEKLFLYESLYKIEKHFEIQFDTFLESNIKKKDFVNIHKLRLLIADGLFTLKDDNNLKLDGLLVDKSLINAFKLKDLKNRMLLISLTKPRTLKVLEQNISLGEEKVLVFYPEINMLDLDQGKVSVKSKSGQVGYTYSQFEKYHSLGSFTEIWKASTTYKKKLKRLNSLYTGD